RVMTHRDLSWLSCFYVIILWEFSASVTPSVVGGGVVAIFLLLKEGVSLGKSLAYVIVASIFDNLFFMAAASLSFLGAYDAAFTEMATLEVKLDTGLKWVFWSSYTFTALYTLIMLLAIFVRPQFFRWALLKLTSIRLLKRWQPVARQHGDEMILASQALQGERWRYWLDVGLATLVAWSARYLVLNLIVASYLSLDFITNLSILGKQVIMWTVMLVSPTPGSSGTAEFFYKQLYGNTLGDYTLITGVLWRLLTNYFYLTLGAIFLPRWIKRIFATPQRLQPCEIGKA
ncbi:MAG: lysylphosphatidylglycerol synthase transmembrane domain-containing protein, partial [Bacteroidota bacterium]